MVAMKQSNAMTRPMRSLAPWLAGLAWAAAAPAPLAAATPRAFANASGWCATVPLPGRAPLWVAAQRALDTALSPRTAPAAVLGDAALRSALEPRQWCALEKSRAAAAAAPPRGGKACPAAARECEKYNFFAGACAGDLPGMRLYERTSLFSASPDLFPSHLEATLAQLTPQCGVTFVGDSLAEYEWAALKCAASKLPRWKLWGTSMIKYEPITGRCGGVDAAVAAVAKMRCGVAVVVVGAHFNDAASPEESRAAFSRCLENLARPLGSAAERSAGGLAVVFATAPMQHFPNNEASTGNASTAFDHERLHAGRYAKDRTFRCGRPLARLEAADANCWRYGDMRAALARHPHLLAAGLSDGTAHWWDGKIGVHPGRAELIDCTHPCPSALTSLALHKALQIVAAAIQAPAPRHNDTRKTHIPPRTRLSERARRGDTKPT
ncbi:hypothetical protein M885DRAFT_553231 [Pelagophyceae sp. CCMP2097]|nr:hypothetical protein M885DRAFT_553231 [Pelagophyceae sp. CCMP2097]